MRRQSVFCAYDYYYQIMDQCYIIAIEQWNFHNNNLLVKIITTYYGKYIRSSFLCKDCMSWQAGGKTLHCGCASHSFHQLKCFVAAVGMLTRLRSLSLLNPKNWTCLLLTTDSTAGDLRMLCGNLWSSDEEIWKTHSWLQIILQRLLISKMFVRVQNLMAVISHNTVFVFSYPHLFFTFSRQSLNVVILLPNPVFKALFKLQCSPEKVIISYFNSY